MTTSDFKILPKSVNAGSSATYPLSAEQLQFYRDNGFLLIRKLISLPALNAYRQRFVDICEGRVDSSIVAVVKDHSLCRKGAKPEDYINKIQALMYDKVYSTYFEDPRLLHIVEQLIGAEGLTALHCMLINKPPGTDEHAAHQDLMHLPFEPADKILATWTAIDPVRKENGCLYMLPGSHKPEVLYEHSDRGNESKQFLFTIANRNEAAPEHKRVYLEMDPGDTVVISSTLVHGSRPNVSKVYRKAISCHYASSACRYIDVAGTQQERVAKQVEAELRRRGSDISYIDVWRVNMKPVRGVRSNL